MKILKIDNNYQTKNINTNFKSKTILTKPILTSKIDMFCKSKEVLGNLRNKFINVRDVFSKKLYPAYLKSSIADWDFYINSTDKNMELSIKAGDEYQDLYKDENIYNELKKIKLEALEKNEQRQLKNLLKNFEDIISGGEDLKVLRDKESEIAQKYNSYIPIIDGKEVSKTEISQILEKETDVELRKKAYDAKVKGGDLIAEDLKNFAKMRNEYALKKGFSNYFEYNLKESFEVDLNDLETLLDDVYLKAKEKLETIINKKQNNLKNVFKIDELKQYHYGLLTDDNPEKKVNEYLKDNEQIVDISKSAYKGMGYDIDKLVEEGKLILDLFPRKGKNTHGFCFNIDAGLDTRILANLTNNCSSIDTLMHELGHCVYTLGVSRELPFVEREEYPATTEAIAMMMGDLQKRENIFKDIIPASLMEDLKQKFIEDEMSFVSRAMIIINFEKEMYKNPDQDLKKLWHDMRVKYSFADENEELNNEWATIPHYLSHPAYYQNYFRATIMKAQIYKFLTEKLGNITENSETANYLKENFFKYGLSLEENELIENLTGKKLSVDDLVSMF